MVDIQTFRQWALSFKEAVEQPHFKTTSFRIHKKIFATLDHKNNRVTLKLSIVTQSVFCLIDKSIIYPANGTWGLQGWTIIDLEKIPEDMLHDALNHAYLHVAPPGLSNKNKKP
jgi:predicted DNA-binding protein (MmcQ/YjbR family)